MSRPQRLGTLLHAWNAGAGAGRPRTVDETTAAVSSVWERIVGPQTAQRSRPRLCANGVLTVLTASSSWSAELSFLAPAILEALRRAVPDAFVRRLRFVVASGRSRLLFEGSKRRGVPSPLAPHRAAADAQRGRAAAGPEEAGVLVARLAAAQASLDAWREQQGWRRCAICGRLVVPASSQAAPCAPCQDRERRRDDARVERVMMQAPWLTQEQVRQTVSGTPGAAFRRVRRRLQARWQNELDAAERRLRRGALTPGDRVAAWSYLMLLTGMPGRDIGRAVVRDVLGAAWTNALLGAAAAAAREARKSVREKHP